MKELNDLRKEIDKIDKEIALLYNKRMDVISKINKIKKDNNLNIIDKEREDNLINENLKYVKEEYKDYYISLEKHILKLSKDYQEKLWNTKNIN